VTQRGRRNAVNERPIDVHALGRRWVDRRAEAPMVSRIYQGVLIHDEDRSLFIPSLLFTATYY